MRIDYLAALLVLLLASTVHAQRGDNVLLMDGKTERGEILKASPTAVTMMVRDREMPIAVSTIKVITFENEPASLRSVRESIRDGQLDQALAAWKRVEDKDMDRSIVKEEYAFLGAQIKALQVAEGSVQAKVAMDAVGQFMAQYPESWRTAAALELRGDLAMSMGDAMTAAKEFARLGKVSSGVTKMRSNVRSADALRATGDPGNVKMAMNMYLQVVRASVSNAEEQRQQQLAMVGAMAIAAEAGKADQAIEKLKSIIDNNDPKDIELFARAYNALGDAHRAANQPMDAIIAYLFTDELFYRDPNAHAESLYWQGQLWGELGKNARATQAKNMLRQRYPTSPWLKKL